MPIQHKTQLPYNVNYSTLLDGLTKEYLYCNYHFSINHLTKQFQSYSEFYRGKSQFVKEVPTKSKFLDL